MIEMFAFMAGFCAEMADTSDFGEEEIRVLNPSIPLTIDNLSEWDRILVPKEPFNGDIGINKKKEMFYYDQNNEWINIK